MKKMKSTEFVITAVEPNSIASNAGIIAGDILVDLRWERSRNRWSYDLVLQSARGLGFFNSTSVYYLGLVLMRY
jgi:hypothetical protein